MCVLHLAPGIKDLKILIPNSCFSTDFLKLLFLKFVKGNFCFNSRCSNRYQICPLTQNKQKIIKHMKQWFRITLSCMKDIASWEMRHKCGEAYDCTSLLPWENFPWGERGSKNLIKRQGSPKEMDLGIQK